MFLEFDASSWTVSPALPLKLSQNTHCQRFCMAVQTLTQPQVARTPGAFLSPSGFRMVRCCPHFLSSTLLRLEGSLVGGGDLWRWALEQGQRGCRYWGHPRVRPGGPLFQPWGICTLHQESRRVQQKNSLHLPIPCPAFFFLHRPGDELQGPSRLSKGHLH